MAKIRVQALQSFAHGSINARRGDLLLMDEGMVKTMRRFVAPVEEKQAAAPSNKMLPDSTVIDPGKAPAAGVAKPSSSSPAAPASPPTMRNKSAGGGKRGRAGGSLRST